MINAVPNHQPTTQKPQSTPSAAPGNPPTPPPSSASVQAPPTTPPQTSHGAIHTPEAQPHGQAGHFADQLAEKVGQTTHPSTTTASAANSSPTPNLVSTPGQTGSPILTTPSAVGRDSSVHTGNANKPKKGPRNTVIAGVLLFLALAGGGAGYYLSQQDQDIRQQAASEEVTDTEISRSNAEWQAFHSAWEEFIAQEDNTWVEYVLFAQSAGSRYDCHEPVMTVGSETLYGCDLNALFVLYELDAYIQPQHITPQDSRLNAVLDKLITNSGLLQEAESQGILTLDEAIFNNSSKDTFARYEALSEVREQFADQFEKRVDFEAVSIYFHNQVEPEIPLEEAKVAAKAKMDNLYARLQAGEITMEQAGAEIRADSIQGDETGVSLAQMDEQYQGNAYMLRNGHIFNARIFKDPTFDEELRSLGEGQMSTVRLCQDYVYTDTDYAQAFSSGVVIEPPMVESCYMIFKVNAIEFGLFDEGDQAEDVEALVGSKYKNEASINQEAL